MRVPEAEVAIDERLVRALLVEQHPDLADLPLEPAGEGWDNAIWRLGRHLAVRLPRRELAVGLLEHERRWLPGLAERLPVAVPTPRYLGVPGCGYPWPWHVVEWLPGATADVDPLDGAGARRLGEALRALHVPALPTAPHNPYRSVPLGARQPPLALLRDAGWNGGRRRLERVWDAAVEAAADAEPTWVHGDVHVRNLLVSHGDLVAIIDWGDLCAGDRAVDLSVLHTSLAPGLERAFADGYGPLDAATAARARGWAIVFSTIVWISRRRDDRAWARLAHASLTRLATCG